MDSILITGSSGTVGSALAKRWATASTAEIFLLVHTSGAEMTSQQFLEQVIGLPSTHHRKNIYLLRGDITKKNLGLSRDQLNLLQTRLSVIVHAAASTRFDMPLAAIRAINVAGVRNILNLATTCPKLQKIGFLSTAYVSGRRTGTILETELDHDYGFVNTYEQSKYEAEKLVRQYSNSLPTTVYRLSTVLGDSRDGSVSHFTAPHQALRIMYLGLASMIPGDPDYIIDFMPSDYATNTIYELIENHYTAGQTYHITATPEKSYSLRQLIDASFQELRLSDPAWAGKQFPMPALVSPEVFELFIHSARQAGNSLITEVLGALGHFAHQLTLPKSFDHRQTRNSLPRYSGDLPDIRSYYPQVVQYCLRTKWGRNV